LQAYADGRVPEDERSRLDGHLETCARCQQALERLVAGDDSWSDTARRLHQEPPTAGVALRQVIEKLKEEGSMAETRDLPAIDDDLSFLSPSEKPGQLGRLGPYEVLEVIGRGGMGVVLKAFDPSLQRVVAIKVLAPHLAASGTARRRFTREARAAAAVSHDHVVTIFAVEENHRPPYLVMQYVAGRSLQQRLDESGPLELKEILRIGMQTAAGLAAAHAQGLVHRDIKPANILLENGLDRVKITDFGLARAADDASLTQSGVVPGTPQYMAPEQARGEALDHRADLFSLGSTLYAMATGRPPFRASSTLAVLRRVADDTPRPVREVNPDVPAWLAAIIEKLHAKSPAQRFQSAAEVAELLGQHLAQVQQPASPRPPLLVLPPKAPEPAPAPQPPLTSLTICPLCGCHLDVPEKLVGRQVTCPRCGKPFLVEEGSEEIQIVRTIKSQRIPRRAIGGVCPSWFWWRVPAWLLIAFVVGLVVLLVYGALRRAASEKAASRAAMPQSATRASTLPAAGGSYRLHDALDWFPQDATFVGAIDLRAPGPLDRDRELVQTILLLLPSEISRLLTADNLGALQIERVAFAYCEDRSQPDQSRRFLRLSGRGNQARLTERLAKLLPGAKLTREVGPPGLSTCLISQSGKSVALALVGDTDVIVAGYQREDGRHLDVVKQALAVRAGQKRPLSTGTWNGYLEELSPDTWGFVAGEVPAEVRRELANRQLLPFTPDQVNLQVRGNERISLSLDVSLAAGDYEAFQKAVAEWKRKGLAALADLRADPETLDGMRTAWKSLRATDSPWSDGLRPASRRLWRAGWSPAAGPFRATMEIPADALPGFGEMLQRLAEQAGSRSR
jgi:serine/threonine protein kinase